MDKQDTNNIIKIVCPSVEELSVIINNVSCNECGLSFRNMSRLRMHVLKTHKRKKLEKTVKEDIRYHCPEISCIYSIKSQRYFASMKYVKQHYLKVHAVKKFPCSLCDKIFSTEAVRDAHSRRCGIQFTCSCLKIFGSYGALITHAKRAFHSIDEKYKNIFNRRIAVRTSPLLHHRGNRPVSILPQCALISLVDRTIGSSVKVSLDVAVQTDDIKRQKRTQSPSKTRKRRESRQTQTSVLTKKIVELQRKTVETQTIDVTDNHVEETNLSRQKIIKINYSSKKNDSFVRDDLALNENYGNEHLFPVSPLQLKHDVRIHDFWEDKNPSLGTQTNPEKDLLGGLNESVTEQRNELNCLNGLTYTVESIYPFNNTTESTISRSDPMLTVQTYPDRFSSIETQTEMGYSFDSDVGLSTNFAVSSNFAETQTTENFHNMEQLLYSNTCTQTCNDILPSDLGLSDIQTQTAWPELTDGTVAAETQTRDDRETTSSCRSWLNIRTSQTQTDLLSMFDEFQ